MKTKNHVVGTLARAAASRANGAMGGRPRLVRVEAAGAGVGEFWARLTDGETISVSTTCNPAAFDRLVCKISEQTGQTDRGVQQSLRRWIS